MSRSRHAVHCGMCSLGTSSRWAMDGRFRADLFHPPPGLHTRMKAFREVSPPHLFPGGESPGAPGAPWGFVLLRDCGSEAQSGLTQGSRGWH